MRFSAQYWRERAEEVRVQAEQMNDPTAKRTMLVIVEEYEQLAAHAEESERKELNGQGASKL